MYYCYFWLRVDGTPYYVGKGCGDRGLKTDGHRLNRPSDLSRIILQGYDSEQEAFEAEIFFIAFFGRVDLDTGCLYNLTDGGEGCSGYIVTEEGRIRLSQLHRGRKRPPRTTEHRRNISLAKLGEKNPNFGRRPSQITLERRRVTMSARPNPFAGKKHSEETKAHWSRIRTGRKASQETRARMRATAARKREAQI